MDGSDALGAEMERARVLFNTNLRYGMSAGAAGIRSYFQILETLSREYPSTCPVLLLWRVRIEIQSAALAPHLIYWTADRRARLLKYDAMAQGWRLRRRCYASIDGLCRSLCSEVGSLGTRICGPDVAPTRNRSEASRAYRSLTVRRKTDLGYDP